MRRSRQVRLWHSGCYLAKHLALQQNARRLDNLEGLYFPGDQAMPKLTRFPLLVSDSHCVPVIDMIVPQHARVPTRKAYLHVKTALNNILTFVLYFRYHASLPDNLSLQCHVDQNIRWAGDAAILKVGKRGKYVHLQGAKDKSLATFAIKR